MVRGRYIGMKSDALLNEWARLMKGCAKSVETQVHLLALSLP